MEQAVAGLAKAQQQASELRNRYLGLAASDVPRWVQVNTVVEETIEMLRPEAQQCNVLLELEAATDLPKVWARPGHLRQILLNLGLNPIQLMAAIDRSGSVRIKTTHVTNAELPVHVRIIDEGPGVHTSLRERIFEFGFTTKEHGAGLGLTICRQIASKLGGTVQVEESYMLWGTTFLLALPGGEGDG
jgi:signal transduction histidine kinase